MKRNTCVSVIIPCRNEFRFINTLINCILNQDYPANNVEYLFIDGMSTDGTREVVKEFSKRYNFIKLIDNPNRTVPYALNIGIRESRGDVIVRLDAHAEYPGNYISTLVRYLQELNADNVGASAMTLPANGTRKAKAIAISMSSLFGVGNATFRLGKSFSEEYIEVDTVPFGCYRRDVFDRIGLFDEELTRNQDNEFNERLKNSGGKIYLIPNLKISYFARENYTKLFKMFYQYGYFGPLVDLKLKRPTRLRRYIPIIFVLSLVLPLILALVYQPFLFLWLFTIIAYAIFSLIFSTINVFKNNDLRLIPFIMWSYFVSHVSYGLGYIMGFIDFVLLKKRRKDVNLSR